MATAPRLRLLEERTPYKTRKGVSKDSALPYGCITDVAKDVLHNIRRAALSSRAKDFLNYTAVLSFGDAGRARKRGASEPGLTCHFHLAAWAEELGWEKANVLRIRKQVIALNVISFEASETPGEGSLRWNIEFATWRALDPEYRRARYARPNAGRKKREQREPTIVSLNSGGGQSGIVNLNTNSASSVVSLNTQKESNRQRGGIKLTKAARSDARIDQARSDALISNNNSPDGEYEETVTNVTARSAVRADVVGSPVLPVVDAEKPQGSRQHKAAEKREAHNLREQYKRLLVEDLCAYLKVQQPPGGKGKEMAAAEWFYAEGADRAQVIALYHAMKLGWWKGKYLPLVKVQGPWAEHHGDVEAYRAAETRSGQHGNGTGRSADGRVISGAVGGGATRAAPSPGAPSAGTAKTGKYAGVYEASRRKLLGERGVGNGNAAPA